ncbi:tyrosine-type recombinase/integrase [Sulfurimonas sp. SAG-AH-194-C20]|nr:tyrosine-type recombinase/integrase [Sulfurimonas sp. SAG-AH-194-C20]MDF1879029.1 tyrosine-type recombinase/integrase [Sulfurimonas sp. SAG-AH-194-C20]
MSNETLLTKLDNYSKKYIKEKTSLNMAHNTIAVYQRVLESFYEFILEEESITDINEISKEILLKFINKNKESATSSRILYLSVLKAFFSFIDDQEGMKGLFEIKFKKLTLKKESVEVDALNENEVERLLTLVNRKTSSFNKMRDALLIKLILFTGIRASECLDVKLSDFSHIEENSVYKIKIHGKGSKERYVYIQVALIQKELDFLKDYITNYIAITNQNKRMSRVGLYSVISNKMKKALIDKKGVHILRHTFARRLVAKNINLVTISELLGHADITLTAKTYAKSDEGSKVRAILQ